MKFSHALVLVFLLGSVTATAAPQLVKGKDGRDILLNEDGSWEYASEASLVETADGRKARLKADNTWEYLEESTPSAAPKADDVIVIDVSKKPQVTAKPSASIMASIDEVFITEHETKAGISKATRRTNEMHFSLKVSSTSRVQLNDLDKNAFVVRDSRGGAYGIESVSFSSKEIDANKSATITVVTDDAPGRLFSPKELYLEIAGNSIGQNEPIKLSYPFGMVDRRDD